MYNIDIVKVRGKMGEKGYNNSSLAKQLRINRNTLKDYFDRPYRMPYAIIAKIAEILCDTNEEAREIFFAVKLTQNAS